MTLTILFQIFYNLINFLDSDLIIIEDSRLLFAYLGKSKNS